MNKAAKTVPRDPATEPVEIHSGNGLGVLSSSEAEDHLLTISRLFWEKRRLLQRAALVGSLIALIVGLLTPNIYHSTSRLMPPDNQSGSGLAALLASRAGNELGFQPGGLPVDLLGVKTRGAVFVEILRSRTAKEDIVDQFDLTSAYGRPWLHQRVALDDADKELGQNTEISEDAKSGVITISVANRDPHLAAKLTQGYVDQLNKLLSGLSTSAAGRERQFLEQRLVEVKKELEDATHQLSEFSSTNSTLDPKEQGRAMVEAAASLQGELIAAESQLKGLEEIYAASNVRIRSLQARIAELQRQVRHVSGLTSSASPAEVGDANMPFPSIRQLPYLGATYADLYRRVKIQETVYELLTQIY